MGMSGRRHLKGEHGLDPLSRGEDVVHDAEPDSIAEQVADSASRVGDSDFAAAVADEPPAVYASRVVLPPPMQDLLLAGQLTFAGRELNPLDCDERFPSPISSSPFPGFILTLRAPDPIWS
jgi:hypothetical protein